MTSTDFRVGNISKGERDKAYPSVSNVFITFYFQSHYGILLILLLEYYKRTLQGSGKQRAKLTFHRELLDHHYTDGQQTLRAHKDGQSSRLKS